MTSIISKLSSFALALIGSAGYLGLFVLSAIESCGIPIPSEVVIPFSGFLVSQGKFSLWAVILMATMGNLVGSIVLYFIGLKGGRWLLERYGKFVLISRHSLDAGDRWFKKYGSRAVFWSRILPIVRTFISLPAGVAKMNFNKFILYTFLGSLPWNIGLAYLGLKIGERWDILHTYSQKLDIAILVLVVLGIIWLILRHFRHAQEVNRI